MYFCCLCGAALGERVVIEAGITIREPNPCTSAECRTKIDGDRADAGLSPLPNDGPRWPWDQPS